MILKRHGRTIKKGWSYQGKLMFDAYVELPVTGFPTPNMIHVEVQNFGTARGHTISTFQHPYITKAH